jgi:hypothetical protein
MLTLPLTGEVGHGSPRGEFFQEQPGRCQGNADVSHTPQGGPGEDPRRFPGPADISRTSQDAPGSAESMPVAESLLTLTPATGVGRASEIRPPVVSRSILSARKTASVPLAWAMRFDAVSLTPPALRRSGLRPPALASGLRRSGSGLRRSGSGSGAPAPAPALRPPALRLPRCPSGLRRWPPAPPAPQEGPQNALQAPRRASGHP